MSASRSARVFFRGASVASETVGAGAGTTAETVAADEGGSDMAAVSEATACSAGGGPVDAGDEFSTAAGAGVDVRSGVATEDRCESVDCRGNVGELDNSGVSSDARGSDAVDAFRRGN